jgi:PAS domain-containing protein
MNTNGNLALAVLANGRITAECHYRFLGRRDYQQGPRWRHHELEYMRPAALRLSGRGSYRPDRGRAAIPDDRQEEEPDILGRLRKGERADHFETVRRCKDGSLIDISLTISPVKDHQGRVIGASKVACDITGRKKSEKRLVEQTHLLDLSSDAILVRDAQGSYP